MPKYRAPKSLKLDTTVYAELFSGKKDFSFDLEFEVV